MNHGKYFKLKYFKFLFNIVFFLFAWKAIIFIFDIPSYILPNPFDVINIIFLKYEIMLEHIYITFLEIILGIIFGIFIGFLMAILIYKFKLFEKILLPIVILSQAIPVFAFAPILVLWFGYGISSKIFMTTIVIFFPIVSNFYQGLKKIDSDFLNLAYSMKASQFNILFKIEIPSALPYLGIGIKNAVVYAPIAATIGEWVGSSNGIGYMMLYSLARFQIDEMFAYLLVLIFITLSLYYFSVYIIEKIIFWR